MGAAAGTLGRSTAVYHTTRRLDVATMKHVETVQRVAAFLLDRSTGPVAPDVKALMESFAPVAASAMPEPLDGSNGST